MMSENKLRKVARETLEGVFHANDWGVQIPENMLQELIECAKKNPRNKARLCLHPSSEETIQITYLAFYGPYADGIHKHPDKSETIIPILGEAKYYEYDFERTILNSVNLNGTNPVANTTTAGKLHGIELISKSFVMLEIGKGPFNKLSTVYL